MKPEDIACNLHYFATGILKNLGTREIKQGEDGFVIDLYHYAKVLTQLEFKEAVIENKPGVYVYEFAEDIAAKLYLQLWDEGELDSFNKELHDAVAAWCGLEVQANECCCFSDLYLEETENTGGCYIEILKCSSCGKTTKHLYEHTITQVVD